MTVFRYIQGEKPEKETSEDAANPVNTIEPKTTTAAKRPSLMTWLMPELTTLWVMCAPLTHYGILKTPVLITKLWASYGFGNQRAGRGPVGVFESSDCPPNPRRPYELSLTSLCTLI